MKSKAVKWGIGLALLVSVCISGVFILDRPTKILLDDRVYFEVRPESGLQEITAVYEYRVVDKQAREMHFEPLIGLTIGLEELPPLIALHAEGGRMVAVVDKSQPKLIYILYDLESHESWVPGFSWHSSKAPGERMKAEFEREYGVVDFKLR